jgi:GTP cyclohydrolase III
MQTRDNEGENDEEKETGEELVTQDGVAIAERDLDTAIETHTDAMVNVVDAHREVLKARAYLAETKAALGTPKPF